MQHLPQELLQLIKAGEDIKVEFKASVQEITKDVYETVCAFSNREGGHIFLGVKDNGTILGIDVSCVEKLKKNFITSVNNENKFYPPLYLVPKEYEVDGRIILHVRVPVGTTVYRCNGRIYDRNHEADIDITNNAELVYKLYYRKQSSHFVNKVYPAFSYHDLNSQLIERARRMTIYRAKNHPWMQMTDEELLRSAGLILHEPESGREGITLAAILLFGSDNLIMSVLCHHKTDAIYRVYNTDRYDDRDVIITNLLDSYERLMAFGQKHLNDKFTLDGIISVSARDKILREIVSNSLAHRDYSNAYVAKLVIEKNRMYTENSNYCHGYGSLDLATFEPFPKNPPISKVFREIGLADELGSGMRNTYKFTQLYSGANPDFIEGDVFKTIVPLDKASATKLIMDLGNGRDQVRDQVRDQDRDQEKIIENVFKDKNAIDKAKILISFCETPKSKQEMMEKINLVGLRNFREKYLKPLLEANLLAMTIPDKPTSRNQKYVMVKKQ